mgnify:CR=1 FL=1
MQTLIIIVCILVVVFFGVLAIASSIVGTRSDEKQRIEINKTFKDERFKKHEQD